MRKMHVLVLGALAAAVSPIAAQQSHWAAPDDPTAKYIVEMERRWNEEICVNNGVVAGLLAEDFEGTSTGGERFTKADELRDEKGPHSAHDCGLDEARVRFFGDSMAVVYGSEHSVGKDKARPGERFCQIWTDTWLKRGGVWQVVASQDGRGECR